MSAKEEFGLYGVNLPVTEFENKSLIKEDLQALRQAGLWCSLWFIHTAETAAYAETLGMSVNKLLLTALEEYQKAHKQEG